MVGNNKRYVGFPAQPIRLVNLVEYQEGSVVTRTILDKEMGKVTLFAFDTDQGLS